MSKSIYQCEICSKSFKSLQALYGHKSIHSEKYKNHIDNLQKVKSINHCKNCDKKTSNPKFCSQSCSATYNNPTSKRKHNYGFCIECNTKLKRSAKYCSHKCQGSHQRREKVLNEKASPITLKAFLIETEGHHCWQCKNSTWNEQPIPLELEHIDGNSQNNSLDNLSILCPNCHAQTHTYKGKNKGNGRFFRRERYSKGKSY